MSPVVSVGQLVTADGRDEVGTVIDTRGNTFGDSAHAVRCHAIYFENTGDVAFCKVGRVHAVEE